MQPNDHSKTSAVEPKASDLLQGAGNQHSLMSLCSEQNQGCGKGALWAPHSQHRDGIFTFTASSEKSVISVLDLNESKLKTNIKVGSGLGCDVVYQQQTDWTEPWLLGLAGFHVLCLLLTCLSSQRYRLQVGHFLCLVLVTAGEFGLSPGRLSSSSLDVVFKIPVFRFKGDVHFVSVLSAVAVERHDHRGYVGAKDFECDDRPEELTREEERKEEEKKGRDVRVSLGLPCTQLVSVQSLS
ncbi:hypothetical protein HPG69_008332 [Diceros bicornis minor]|uniref:Uncharacterized protein n=1 Tax=Diceros bicornis minor TaxID=77932 RepID=A0A7J7EN85_DICBM|nr:hypothetical protein HPG69_008332 [Diceros bicornis minor]